MKIKSLFLVSIGLFVGSVLVNGVAYAVPGFFTQNGNSFLETATLGTTDNFDLRVITNNTEKLRIQTGGNVGIGTSSPSSKLHVAGTGNITGNLTLGGTLNGLTLSSLATGFSIAGGTTSKILTLSGDSSLNQNLLTSSSPSFAGLTLTGPLTSSSSTGTSGQVLTSNGSSSAPSWQNSAGEGTLVSSGTFSTTLAANTFTNILDITGLAGDTDEMYRLLILSDKGSSTPIWSAWLRFNNDITDSYTWRNTINSTTTSFSNGSSPDGASLFGDTFYVYQTEFFNVDLIIKASKLIAGGYRSWMGQGNMLDSNPVFNNFSPFGYWTNTTDELTSIQLIGYRTNLGIGGMISGKYYLYKIKTN